MNVSQEHMKFPPRPAWAWGAWSMRLLGAQTLRLGLPKKIGKPRSHAFYTRNLFDQWL